MKELSDWFVGAAAKRLSAVEINPGRSNQHEFQATRLVRQFLGESERRTIDTRFLYFSDDSEPLVAHSWVTYYDARSGQPQRSPEYRLYYPDNEATDAARAGDLLVFALLRTGTAVAAMAREGSTYASQLLWLFDITVDSTTTSFVVADDEAFQGQLTPLDADVLLDLFGIEVELASTSDLDLVTARFGTDFPTTAEFSAFAREQTPGPEPREDPDGALLAWSDTEYRLFQAFERAGVSVRLDEGFTGDAAVENFLRFSLSVQNRRKSRSGHSFEHHLAAVFEANDLSFQRGVRTERKAKPDFLFPGQTAYDDPTYPPERLSMIGAKTTAKDRWRQVLQEADRVPVKHLATLEAAISSDQTSEMQALNIQLVVPREVQVTYTLEQRDWLWSLAEFIDHRISMEQP